MIVYVVLNSDRHYGIVTELFSTPDAAVARARWIAETCARGYPIQDEPVEGELLHWRYSPEDGSVWVVEQTVQGAP